MRGRGAHWARPGRSRYLVALALASSVQIPCAAGDVASTGALSAPQADARAELTALDLMIPVAGVSASSLRDTYAAPRGAEAHEAIDIAAARGTAVLAATSGRIAKLFHSVPGGNTIYQFDPSERFALYYAHLDRYAEGVREGMHVDRGEVIGYVGTTGNAPPDSPHLHFAIFRLGPGKEWWKGTPVNPYPALQGRR